MENKIIFNEKIIKIPSVCIIISAFNAEKYIKEQIESIFAQKNVDIKIWIRDDGSTDATLSLLKKLYGNDSRMKITSGQNLGAAESFIEAIFACDFVCDYYGFSDADDVWIDDKMEYSIEIIKKQSFDKPVAAVTRLKIVDQYLNPIGYTEVPRKGLSFRNALVQTVASGASTTMNQAAFKILRIARPSFVVMHDAWTYLVITAFGQFYYGESPKLLYRQHASNVFGANYSWRKKVKNRANRFFVPNDSYFHQAEEFYKLYGERLDCKTKKDISNYLNYKNSFYKRLRFVFFPSITRQKFASNIYMRLLILFGKE